MNIRELAEAAGVSPATVSLVLNEKPGVGEETRARVMKLAEELNYKGMSSTKKAKNILFLKYIKHGMIVEENAGFISTIMDSIENDCRAQGYTLSIVLSENQLEKTLSEIDYDNFYGIIFLGTELDENTYPLLNEIPIPYVVVDNVMPHFDCSAIAIDNFEIVYGALSHLKELGYKEIAYFRSNIRIQNFIERADAFYKYSGRFGFSFEKVHEFKMVPTLLGSFQSMTDYLRDNPRLPACVFADNDTIAIGAMKALKKAGYRIPEDIAVIGFDDIPFAAINSPTLSTMRVPKKAIGSLALRQLLMKINNDIDAIQKTRVGGELIIRHSTQK
ncbi:LacI family DNA-binding transcriptional regulator [Bariatricus massiliensis]|uniref:LacI family DNA-binding transcriptional regulator n=1 Tax=Bariatricus massiliensis TaxID=1745713 RepID=A0ABS8DL20_9FIRM|nr:LacI family DNA-binding transcriptional regulator [Bariatricus massiliensis]MCB7306008.1 LacI family DNA-binding transcriptional regulator [Bariatricus massiliensis]MCB7374700.1 LacI family DNA-binding transcriptional regulator [Bariatricus massiliensis]MCB7389151.1 LacI family DNA-binding transcriptional regulator [Bariatricus massiliensis]MCB7413324.1 LacI family DNA-binding transcriptional regulator [Bariatricus massiliensis]MCQ5255214.1 LacI family DNA-binding transcriptional regulator 